jgi:hypothetical protein
VSFQSCLLIRQLTRKNISGLIEASPVNWTQSRSECDKSVLSSISPNLSSGRIQPPRVEFNDTKPWTDSRRHSFSMPFSMPFSSQLVKVSIRKSGRVGNFVSLDRRGKPTRAVLTAYFLWCGLHLKNFLDWQIKRTWRIQERNKFVL